MAQGSIAGGNPVEDVHTRTTTSGPQSQAVVLGIDGSDAVVTAHSTRGLRVDVGGSNVVTATDTIATAGAPKNLGAQPCKSVFVTAYSTNTLQVAIGDSNVNADSTALRGIPLQPGQGIALDIENTNLLYFDVLGDGHKITWTAIT